MNTTMQGEVARRQTAMATLVHATEAEIAGLLSGLDLPPSTDLRAPDQGLVMVRGRIGGDGAPFNLGEATVSRAAVKLATGEIGFGYTLGRNPQKAQLIALCDALIQSRDHRDAVEAHVIAPLRDTLAAKHARRAAETAATRVDFYTLVRGEG